MAFTVIASEISKYCTILDEYISSEGLPHPSLGKNGPLEFPITSSTPQKIKSARQGLLDAAETLRALSAGPAAMLVWSALSHPYELSTLRTLQRFKIPEAVSIDEPTSFQKVATTTGLDREFVTRIIKHASTYHVFSVDETSGTASHTAPSRALAEHQGVRDSLAICLDERFLSTAGMMDHALLKYGSIDEPRKTAFNMAFGTDGDYLAFLRAPEQRQELASMHGFLGFIMGGTKLGTRHHDMSLLAGYSIDWEALGDGLVVDMGGGHGHVSVSIAQKHSRLRFLIQDLPQIVADGRQALINTTGGDASVASRISFMEHDFLSPQTVHGADVFMFRFVIHDWSDKYVAQILQNIVPAMKPGARIIIMDYVVAAAGSVPKVAERLERTMDLAALSIIAGKERSVNDWYRLVKRVGGGLGITDIHTDRHSAFGLVVLGICDGKT